MATHLDAPPAAAHLVLCDGCGRHVRASESACPFCLATLAAVSLEKTAPAARLGRAALRAFGVGALSAATAVTACNHTPDSAMVTVYGGPPPDLENHLADAGDAASKPAPSAVPSAAPAAPSSSSAPAATPKPH